MSTVSDAIKTSILVGLAIVFLHVLAKARIESVVPTDRYYASHAPPLKRYADADGAESSIWKDVVTSPNTIDQPNEPMLAQVASETADVLDYVFGPVNLAASVAPPPAPHPAPAGKSDKQPTEAASSGLHMVIGSYENESAMCGGRIFEGVDALQGFDDVGNSFASV